MNERKFLAVFILLFLAACGGGDSGLDDIGRNPTPSESASKGGQPVAPTPSINLAGMKLLPRTLTVGLSFESGQTRGSAPTVTLTKTQFTDAQATYFLPRENAEIWFELKNAGGEALFSGGMRDPLRVIAEPSLDGQTRGSAPTFNRRTVQVRLPVRAGAEKLVITRLGKDKRQLAVIDLVPVLKTLTP